MGSQYSSHHGTNAGINDMQQSPNDKNDAQKHQSDAPLQGYARPAQRRPKLLPEVQDTINHFRSGSKISGQANGTKILTTYELLKNPGVFYEGEWKGRVENGKGIARGLNGTYLEGYFANGKANGWGFHVYPDGSYYNGEFKDGAFNGKGKFFYKLNKMTYDGQWRNGKPEGKGIQHFPGIGKYEGQFLNGLKHGKGEMKWDDGRQYEGAFQKGYMHGEGILKKHKGYYKGKFEQNNKTTNGMKTQFGTYDGPFYRGQMSGRGKFTWNNGNVYEGDFKFNKMHGKGKMTLKNNQVYTGDWQNGINVNINQ